MKVEYSDAVNEALEKAPTYHILKLIPHPKK